MRRDLVAAVIGSKLGDHAARQREREERRARERAERLARESRKSAGASLEEAEWAAGLRFYGLDRARAEGWAICTLPDDTGRLEQLRRRGAVVIWCNWDGDEWDGDRLWYFGLPPANLSIDLGKLAKAAGMLGDDPATFRWYQPAVVTMRLRAPIREAA